MELNQPAIQPIHRAFYGLSIGFSINSAIRSIDFVSDLIEKIERIGSVQPIYDVGAGAVLDELQNVVLQGAAISRFFWPVREKHEARGQQLRFMYEVLDSSPLRSRDLRNAIEHFDERLDRYLAENFVGNFIPEFIGPEPVSNGVPTHYFRAYFIESGIFELLGERYEIEPIAHEILRISRRSEDP